MYRKASWAVVMVVVTSAGCNRSGSGLPDQARLQGEAIAALKGLDAQIEPDEPTSDQPVSLIVLTGNKVTDDAMVYVARFTKLTDLRLKDTVVTAAGLGKLSGLAALKKLDLSGTKIGDDGVARISHLAGLQSLYLNETAVTDAGMASVGKLTGLSVLELANTAVGDAGLEKLKPLILLSELRLDGTKVTDKGMDYLQALPALKKTVSLAGTAVTAAGIEKLKQDKPDLKVAQ